jgi:hypothetical protein
MGLCWSSAFRLSRARQRSHSMRAPCATSRLKPELQRTRNTFLFENRVLLLSPTVRVHTADVAADGDDAHLPIDSRPAEAASPGFGELVPGISAMSHAAIAAFERRLTLGCDDSSAIETSGLRSLAASTRDDSPTLSFAFGHPPIAGWPDGNRRHFVRHLTPSKANNEEGNADQRAAARREPHRDC